MSAQDVNTWQTQNISVEDGLSNRFVNDIAQDSRGFIWIGTNFGLNRYDGQHIDILTHESHQLQSNSVFDIFPDVHQQLWIIYRETVTARITGIDVLDPISFKVVPLEAYGGITIPVQVSHIRSVVSDDYFNLYILTDQHDVYRCDGKECKRILDFAADRTVQRLVPDSNFLSITFTGIDTLFIYQPDGLPKNQYAFPHFPGSDTTQQSWLPWGQYVNTRHSRVWGILQNKIQYWTELQPDGFSGIQQLNYDKHTLQLGSGLGRRQLWGKDLQGLFILDQNNNKLEYAISTASTALRTFYIDALGNNWMGSNDGVTILSRKDKYFASFLSSPGPNNYSCRGFTEMPNGDVYLLTYNGNVIFHPETKAIENWKGSDDYIGLAITTDHKGDVWSTTEGKLLLQYQPSIQRMIEWRIDSDIEYFASWCIQEIRQNELWVGTNNGLWIKSLNSKDAPRPFDKVNGFDMLHKSAVYHILKTHEGVWLTTDKGLFLVDPDRGVLQHLTEENSGLPNNLLVYLHIDQSGVFWLASRGGGLIRWDRERKTFRPYTINEGLSHNSLYAVFEDDFGFLWIPSDLGLMRFEKATGTVRTFLQNEGIPHEEFNRASYMKDSKGNLYFGTLSGFIRFHPKDMLKANSINLPVRLTQFEVIDEQTGEIADFTFAAVQSQAIHLNATQSSFRIHYAILDFDDPKLKRYAYYIEGLHSTWTYLTDNFIRIGGLKGGEYTIHIKGQSSTGQWSANELTIPITIRKPFFARWYSQLALLFCLLGAFIVFYKKRVSLQQAKLLREMAISNQLRQVDKLKDQFLANTSHELRTPLNGIVGLSESLLENSHTEQEKEDLELIIASGRRLSNLVNDILDFSRLKEHDLQLNLKPVDIRTMADLCLRINRNLLQEKNLVLRNEIPDNIPYCLGDENRLQQILQNLVANAIKFTAEGSITIDAKQEDDKMVISVTDTGIGIEKEKQEVIFSEFEQADGSIAREFGGTGLGLSISKYLVELHGGNISVDSTPGNGSTFSFTIPVYTGDTSVIAENERAVTGVIMKEEMQIIPTFKPTKSVNGDNASQRHILIVDDEPVNLKVLSNHLERAGYRVTLAHDGLEALQLIEHSGPFHLVLLDVMMPRISGYEVCQRIREKHLLTALPVIMVTAKNQINDLVEGLGIGANDYIVKPFSKDELLSRVKTQLDHYHIHEATNRFIPHEFIHSLGRQSIIDLNRGDMVEQHVHVMFSDIRDYTALAEDMTPQENFKFVNALAGKVGPIVKKNHGMINQYLGDTIMMLFMQKADDGVQTGIDILRMIADYNIKRHEQRRKPIRLGIGLHSGPLMMGIIGDAGRTDAAVISDTVNTASRMEGLTKFFNVNFILSDETLHKIEDRNRFNLRYLGKVQAKGKYNTLDIYECFDGDSDTQVALKRASLQNFHAGMEAYFAKDLDAARKYFDLVYQENPADTTALGFLHRIHHHIINGLPENWSGVEVMVSK